MLQQKKIVLMGYMASGKTVIGKALSKKLRIKFIDLDDFITHKEGLTVPEIFKEKGELFFRKLEYKYLKQLLDRQEDFVLSLGGGTPTFHGIMDLIMDKALSIYLRANVQTLYDRLSISDKAERPMLTYISTDLLKEYIGMHLFERNNFYCKADKTVDVDGLSIEAIVGEIIKTIPYSK